VSRGTPLTAFPGSPQVLKGALVSIEAERSVPVVIAFQYNPATVTRQLESRGADGGPTANRLAGAPVETITLEVELDATDALEKGDPIAKASGILPQLSALETLLYPSSIRMVSNAVLAATGTIEIIPPAGRLVLFVWGASRVLPVSVKQFSVVEEAHDPKLVPIRARVSLGLRVLSYDDLGATHPGFSVFLAHHVAKEALAMLGSASSLATVLGG
jgi:hypothetical protein